MNRNRAFTVQGSQDVFAEQGDLKTVSLIFVSLTTRLPIHSFIEIVSGEQSLFFHIFVTLYVLFYLGDFESLGFLFTLR